ncbi:HAMP domain-containing sensor histidine kinase [Umezawaea beigongshangensis]|uniref:HAMP domain-containing sensor histidine kinase n=1 Tax=Umezawaea beigongshangensis TaxID=2780383 RepID=UPI0018F1D0D1|nr:HAMP domain-containing sensor histidine kinase [Umezawaea beigongshangensis]
MRRSLAIVALAVTSMVALAFLVPLAMVVQQLAEDRALVEAERQASALTPVLAITDDTAQLRRALASTQFGTDVRLAVHVPNREPLGTTHVSEGQLATVVSESRAVTLDTGDGRVYLQPIALAPGRTAVVEAYVAERELSRGVVQAWLALSGVAVCLVLGSVLVADRLGARVVRSASDLAGGAAAMGRGDLSARVPVSGPAELAAAGRAFNGMAERVAQLLAAERELVADLSHRLRTPLTALRLDAETLGSDSGAGRIRQAVRALEREVDEIIRTARRGLPEEGRETCDATEVVRDRLVFWSALADDQDRTWSLRGAHRPAPVPLGRAELTAALDALLGNVFRYTPEGTRFAVSLFHQAERVTIVVEDAGPGIADRGSALQRGSSGAGSTGLGMDIARRAAESTGGGLHVDRGPLGGARVQLRLGRSV